MEKLEECTGDGCCGFSILCGRRLSFESQGESVIPAMMYCSETWAVKKAQENNNMNNNCA